MLNIKTFKHTHSPGNLAYVLPEFRASQSQWYISQLRGLCLCLPVCFSLCVSASRPLSKRHGSSGGVLHIETACLCVNEGLWVCDHSCCQRGKKQDVTQLDLSPNLDTHSEPFPCQRQHKPWDPWAGYMLPCFCPYPKVDILPL